MKAVPGLIVCWGGAGSDQLGSGVHRLLSDCGPFHLGVLCKARKCLYFQKEMSRVCSWRADRQLWERAPRETSLRRGGQS
jgi:hypothetical protein